MPCHSTFRALWTLAAAALLAACGGGGGGGSAPPTATALSATEGLYGGTLTGSASSGFELLLLEDGTYWAVYGDQVGGAFQVRSFIQGQGTSNNGWFTSSDTRDFGFSPAAAGSLLATYTPAPALTGTILGNGASVGFSGGAIAATQYVYATPALLSDVAGAWSMSLLDGETASVNVSIAGAITGATSGGCSFSGTAAPRASGKNVFDVSLMFGAAPCTLAGQSVTGIGLAYPLASGARQFTIVVIDAARTYGTAAVGAR